MPKPKTSSPKKVIVVGAGMAGLACAVTAAEQGHTVELWEKASEIGGQFNMAKRIPGKGEFYETLKYYTHQIKTHGVTLKLDHPATIENLKDGNADKIILATGVHPRPISLPGIEHPNVLNYVDVLRDNKPVGKRVALIGAGGIAFDVVEFLNHTPTDTQVLPDIQEYFDNWGIDGEFKKRSGLKTATPHTPMREITMMQRSKGKLGARLGKTTGWIHRSTAKTLGVTMLSEVVYEKIDTNGYLHITHKGTTQVLEVDTIILCAGQVPNRDLATELEGLPIELIGGADVASELDAKRAIRQGTMVALAL